MNKLSPELCQALKDAGFPQDSVAHMKPHANPEHNHLATLMGEGGITFSPALCVANPTLSELIEVCPIEKLQKVCDGFWQAFHETSLHQADGKTPEEAVSRLYLEIHKKESIITTD